MSKVYGEARHDAVGGNWIKLDNGDAFTGAIVDCGAVREVHFDAKPPTAAQPNGSPASDVKHMTFEVYCESITRLSGKVEEINDFVKFEPQVKWCNKVFDAIDAMELAESNPQAIYGHRIKIQRIDERGKKGYFFGVLVLTDLGKLPAGHAALGAGAGDAPATPSAPAPAPIVPRPSGAPAPGAAPSPAAIPVPSGDVMATFRASCAAAQTFPALKAALGAAWKGLTAAGMNVAATTDVYNPRKQALLVGAMNAAVSIDTLTEAWNVAYAETEKDPAMRAICEAASVARQNVLNGAAPDVAEDDIPF